MKNSYWAKRAANNLYEELEKSERVADRVKKEYIKASSQTAKEVKRITRKINKKHPLTQKQAYWIVDKLDRDEGYNELLMFLLLYGYGDVIEDITPQRKKIEELLKSAGLLAIALGLFAAAEMSDCLYDVGRTLYYKQHYEIQKRAGLKNPVKPITDKKLDEVVHKKWSGATYEERAQANAQRMSDELQREVIVSVISDRPIERSAEKIQEVFVKGTNANRRLIRTESNYVANEIQKESYKAAGVDKYMYDAILDLRTTPVCRALDSQVFLVEEAEQGENYPPMHVWCRSTTIAFFDEDLMRKMRRRARNPITGKVEVLPWDMSYTEWYAEMVEPKIKEAENG